MPKLPKISNNSLIIISIILLVLAAGIFVFMSVYLSQPPSPDEKKAQETLEAVGIRSTFAGSVVTIVPSENKLEIKNTSDEVTYEVKLDQKGKVTEDTKSISFTELKVGDKVTVYSKQSNDPNAKKTYIADLITKSVPIKE